MKRILTGSALCLAVIAVSAQPTMEFKAMPVIIKNTGVKCGPCGSWGWTTMNDCISKYSASEQAVIVTDPCYYYDDNTIMMANQYTDALEKTIKLTGYPTFSVNQVVAGSEKIPTLVTAEQAKTWNISMNFEAKLGKDSLIIVRYVKTSKALTGDYQFNTFVMENEYPHTQASQTGTVLHHYVLRQTVPLINKAGGIFGKKLPAEALSGNLWKDTIVVTPLSGMNGEPGGTMYKCTWNKETLKIGLVMYKDGVIFNGYTREDTYKKFTTEPSLEIATVKTLTAGTSTEISWSTSLTTETVTADLMQGTTVVKTIGTAPASAGKIIWNVGTKLQGIGYTVRLTSGSLKSTSGSFSILKDDVSVVSETKARNSSVSIVSAGNGIINLTVPSAGKWNISLYSLDGSELLKTSVQLHEGTTSIESGLKSQMVIGVINGNGAQSTHKIMLK